MKLIKSPVLYFGIALVLAIAFALLAPYIIDWGRYRGDLEAWGQKLTGREVAIRGDIEVRLFPFPKLIAHDVVVANPDGFREPVFASLERVGVQVTLGGLINGELQVESIDLDNPVATLVRMQGNKVNWIFQPTVALRDGSMLEKVRLDQIKVSGGTLHLIDEVRAARGEVEAVAATVSAPSLAGPWRSSGSLQFNGASWTYSLSTAAWDEARPLRFGLRLVPAELTGYSAAIEGEKSADGGIRGQLQLVPVADQEGKGDSEGKFRAITFKSQFAASFERLAFESVEIRPADAGDQGTLITGRASLEFGQRISGKVEVSAPRVDVDRLAGAGSRQLLRNGGGLALVNGLFAQLPKELTLDARVKVLALRYGGETLENAELSIATSADAVTIPQFSANLPGRSRILFSGVFFPGERYAELGGNISVESFDTRQLTYWLLPEAKAGLAQTWTGNRGRLKASSEVRLTASKLEFKNIKYELDGNAGEGRMAMLVNGERPILDAELRSDRVDIDAYLPGGIGALSGNGVRWSGVLSNFLIEQSRRDMRMVLHANEMRLNGVNAQDVTADIETTVRGVDVKNVSIASVSGASFVAQGVMLNTEAGTDGDITMKVTAGDPRGMLRLAGVVPRERDPAWSRPLGRTDLNIVLQARPDSGPGTIGLTVEGSSGPLTLNMKGALSEVLTEKIRTDLSGSINARTSADLWMVMGGTTRGEAGNPGQASFSLSGYVGGSLTLKVQASLFDTKLSYDGTLAPDESGAKGAGEVSVGSEDIADLLRTVGVPLVGNDKLGVSGTGKIQFGDGSLSVTGISGSAAGGPLSGEFTLRNAEVTGEIGLERLSLAQALAVTFLPWQGQPATAESLFAASSPFALSGEFWIRPRLLDFYPGYTVPNGQIGIRAKSGSTQLAAYGKDQTGQKAAFEMKLDTTLAQRKAAISATIPFRLESVLESQDGSRPFAGTATIDVKLAGQGLSPAAVLADLNGGGAFQLADVQIKGVSPEKFTTSIGKVNDAKSLQDSLNSMQAGNGLQLAPMFGAVDFKQGIAAVTPFSFSTNDADVMVAPAVDLPQGRVRIQIALDLKALPALPRMSVTYEGGPSALARREDVSELSAQLGFKILQQGVDELEKVQAEQARLAEQEEQMRKEDEVRLQQFYAQRTELRLRQREQRTFSAQRIIDREREQKRLEAVVAATRQLTRDELGRRLRELSVFGRPLESGEGAMPVFPRPKPVPPAGRPLTQPGAG